jgi:hypothetical protein
MHPSLRNKCRKDLLRSSVESRQQRAPSIPRVGLQTELEIRLQFGIALKATARIQEGTQLIV